MRAVILAAGKSSRLRPLTAEKPKCLLEVGGSTVLDRQIAALNENNITTIAIVTGYQSEKIKAHLEGQDITFIDNTEYETSNNAYSIWLARDFLLADPEGFIICNSDLIFRPAMLAQLLADPAPDGMIIDRSTLNLESDMVKIHLVDGKIVEMSKTLAAEVAVAEAVGPVKFSPIGGAKFIDCIKAKLDSGDRNAWFFYMLSEYAQREPFYPIENNGHLWAEIDTPEDFEIAQSKGFTPVS